MVIALITQFHNLTWREFKLNGRCLILPNLFQDFLKTKLVPAFSISAKLQSMYRWAAMQQFQMALVHERFDKKEVTV